jgi:hypothetical protein
MSNNTLYSTIYKACILASMVSFVIGFFSPVNISLGSYIAGYSVLTLGIMMILIVLFSNILRVSSNDLSGSSITPILITSGPFLLILAVISFILYLLINYKNNINDGNVSPSYNLFSNIILLLLLVQNYLIYRNIGTDNFESYGKFSKVTTSLLYLIGILTAICSIILYIILKYYSTDGFTNFN